MTPEDVILAVGQLADERKWDELRHLFATSVRFDDGEPRTLTHSEIAGEFRARLSPYDRTDHHIHDISLMVDGDRADSISQFSLTHWMTGLPGGDSWTLHGEYIHKLKRTDDTWYITDMRVIPLDTDGNTDIRRLAESEASIFAKTLTRRHHRQILQDFFDALEQRDVESFKNLWHADATLEFPFAPDDQQSLISGVDAITSHYARWLGTLQNLRFNFSIVDTLNPHRFIVIYTSSFNGNTQGGHFHSHQVGFFDVRDRHIVTLTEYANPETTRRIARQLRSGSHASDDRRPPANG